MRDLNPHLSMQRKNAQAKHHPYAVLSHICPRASRVVTSKEIILVLLQVHPQILQQSTFLPKPQGMCKDHQGTRIP